ncbi:MAG: hypothetical protein JSR41_24630 [Proteobacteria bacterium]|nr:hypothetical protein [Pseudomonadota bacterium]
MTLRSSVDTWKRRAEAEAAKFSDGWDWKRVLLHWRERLDDFGLNPHPIFTEIEVYDSANPVGRESKLTWWPKHEVDARRRELLNHFERLPGTVGPVHPYTQLRQGVLDTLVHLWACREEPDKVAGVLISGSLFARIEGRGGRVEDGYWPRAYCVRQLQSWAYDAWRGERSHLGWHFACTKVLPSSNHDYVYKLDTMAALVRYVAEEHVQVLSTQCPIAIHYVDRPGPPLRAVQTGT